jgi:phage terminase large subunit-like protein
VQALQRICRVPYTRWIEQKFITATSGNAIDLRAVLDRIRWGRQMFDLKEVPFDRLNFRTEALNLIDEGIAATEVPQSFLHLSYATKFLLSACGDGKIRHGNNPVLNWMASCLQLQYDHKDNCQPSKPERMRSSKRIDGIQAVVTALARALVADKSTSVYETRGILTLE